jgi:hypothetical protein
MDTEKRTDEQRYHAATFILDRGGKWRGVAEDWGKNTDDAARKEYAKLAARYGSERAQPPDVEPTTEAALHASYTIPPDSTDELVQRVTASVLAALAPEPPSTHLPTPTAPPTASDAPTYGKEVALFDIHHPHHNKPAMASIMTFLGDYKPDVLILGGDALDAGPFSHWNERKLTLLRKERPPQEMYSDFVNDMLIPMRRAVGDNCYIVYMLGNHEDWVRQAIEADPRGEGYWEVEKNVGGIPDQIIPYIDPNIPPHFTLGKLHFAHGYCTNMYHARKVSDDYNKSVRYGHVHDVQTHTHRTAVDVRDFHIARSCGCLCDLSPTFMKNRPNRWVHAFQVGEVLQDGAFADEVPIIIDGKFKAGGRWYGV